MKIEEKIEEKYISKKDYDILKEEDKLKEKRILLNNDAYAICEIIELLKTKLEELRISFLVSKR